MTRIQLNTAALDNGGLRREAGSIVEVGDGERAIGRGRASSLLDRADASEKPSPSKRKIA